MADYKNWIKKGFITNVSGFRDAQIDCFNAAEKNKSGLFELTCGAGKTLIQAALINKELLRAEKKNEQAIVLVASHRLLLNTQLGANYANFIKDFNTRVVVLCLCGISKIKGFDSKDISELVDNVKKKDLKNKIALAKRLKKHVVIITTATSENKYRDDIFDIVESCGLNLYIHDECHKNIDAEIVEKAKAAAERAYYFTATPGEYLKNTLGDALVKYDFKKALTDKIVVAPILYTMNFLNVEDTDHKKQTKYSAECKGIESAYKKLEEIERVNGNVPSLITFVSSIESVDAAAKNLVERNVLKNVNIYSFASCKKQLVKGNPVQYGKCKKNYSEYDANGEEYTKERLLEELRNDKGPKVILNAFMLTEGIDLPSINGVLMLCSKEDASLYQAIMRGCRTSYNKNNFALFAPIRFNGKNIEDEDRNFLNRLIYAIGGSLDFGGHIEDQMDGGDDDNDEKKKGALLIAEFKKINDAISAEITRCEEFFINEENKKLFIDRFYNNLPKREPNKTEYRLNFWKENIALIQEYEMTKEILDM